MPRRGSGRGRENNVKRGRRGTGGPSKCVCPNCGYEKTHERGTSCSGQECPKCGSRMIGKWE